jgi:hypothetical protein
MSFARCTSTIETGGPVRIVNLRCQAPAGHDGRCFYHRKGGQGGTTSRWWGANPKPDWYIGDWSVNDLQNEVVRLRDLLEKNGLDWRRP